MQRTGTGAIIGRRQAERLFVLTAHHVIADADRMTVTFWPHTSAAPDSDAVEVVDTSPAADLALLQVKSRLLPPGILPVAQVQPVLEDDFPP